jgi:hypothetical protein
MRTPIVQTLRFSGIQNLEDGSAAAIFEQLLPLSDENPPFFIKTEDVDGLVLDGEQLVSVLTESFAGSLPTSGRGL